MLFVEETGADAKKILASMPIGIAQRYLVFTSIMSGLSLKCVFWARDEHAGTVFELLRRQKCFTHVSSII